MTSDSFEPLSEVDRLGSCLPASTLSCNGRRNYSRPRSALLPYTCEFVGWAQMIRPRLKTFRYYRRRGRLTVCPYTFRSTSKPSCRRLKPRCVSLTLPTPACPDGLCRRITPVEEVNSVLHLLLCHFHAFLHFAACRHRGTYKQAQFKCALVACPDHSLDEVCGAGNSDVPRRRPASERSNLGFQKYD